MWRSPPSRSLFRALLSGSGADTIAARRRAGQLVLPEGSRRLSSAAANPAGGSPAPDPSIEAAKGDPINFSEAKRLIRLVNVVSLKRRLGIGGEEVIGYRDLLDACQGMGVVRSREEAAEFARVLDEAGVVLLFRDKVYLHPDKVVDLVKGSLPFGLDPEKDPRVEELKQLQKKKEEIDTLAHKQVRRILWSGLGVFVLQTGLFFRLTFWEFSWDVMEPITFFSTTTGLLVGYAYFLLTSRDPSYQDVMKRLFTSRQKKLAEKHNFDARRFVELQKHCECHGHHLGAEPLHNRD